MEDQEIIELYWERDQRAIAETSEKYGTFLQNIAWNVLHSHDDAAECVNDTYLRTWNAIPPARPKAFRAWLGRITRNLSLDRWKQRSRLKRGGGPVNLCLEELSECLSRGESLEDDLIRKETLASIHRFLDGLPQTERKVFLRRYWYLDSVAQIAEQFGFSESKVTAMLHRTRGKLGKHLKKEELA